MTKNKNFKGKITKLFILLLIIILTGGGSMVLYAITLPLPDFNSYFEQLDRIESTKIYDRTGTIVLYDIHDGIKRKVVPLDQISKYVQEGTIAIEDDGFYQHKGIQISSIFRAILVDIGSGSAKQGGSTITQQVIKNTILTNEKTLTRKIKEMVLALRLEKSMPKGQILSIYLNEIPYGGNIYGIEEAARAFFDKPAKDLNLAESAYLSAIPKAPTYYSPYGQHRAELDQRKNLVLDKMAQLGYVTKDEAAKAKQEVVKFTPADYRGITAPHFVFYIKSYLEEKYGTDAIEKSGLRVITSVDVDLQKKAEAVVKKYGEINKKDFGSNNAGLVALDPKTGQILSMVGSVSYFDMDNEGNFNTVTANRQPGSTFKPIVYATLFSRGYTPNTVLFDVPTQFNASCNPDGTPKPGTKKEECYSPVNYDGKFLGPLSIRTALAQSRNIPAVKALYLAGVDNSLQMASKMGITSLGDKNQYGLTLVLGGGEVSLLELTSAYATFANDGIHHKITGVLKVTDKDGNVLEENQDTPGEQVLDPNVAREISDILSDTEARSPAGSQNPLYITDHQVAGKTGTTNDFRDAWTIGYTPNLAVGVWAGNNNNKSMEKKVAGYVAAPMWQAFVSQAVTTRPNDRFLAPNPIDPSLKPILRGFQESPAHSILFYVDKNNPLGGAPSNPAQDSQFNLWESSIQSWVLKNGYTGQVVPAGTTIGNTPGQGPDFTFSSPQDRTYPANSPIAIRLVMSVGSYPIKSAEFYVDGQFIGSLVKSPFVLRFTPSAQNEAHTSEIKVVVYDQANNRTEKTKKVLIDPTISN